MRLSGRARGGAPNDIALVRAELAAAGVPVVDLSDSNPTRHGLTDPRIFDIVGRHVHESARYDPQPRGPAAAREALASRYGGHPDEYWLTSSTSQAYAWLAMLLADPGERIAVPQPGYPLIDPIARLAGVGTVGYRLHYVHPHGWILDADSLTQALTGGTRAVVVVDPGNPTGAYAGSGFEVIAGGCGRADAAVIVDAVFRPFTLDLPAGDIGRGGGSSYGYDGPAMFTLDGLSKLLCAPQLKLGWIHLGGTDRGLGPLRDSLDAIADTFLPVSGPVAAALPELLALADESVARVRGRLAGNLAWLGTALADSDYRVRRCEGGWTAVLDVPYSVAGPALALELLRRFHLAVHPGWFYDIPGDSALAISLLPEPEVFAGNLAVLRTALAELAERAELSD